ncbi:ABC transporter permease [Baekduia sp.]|jgi:taurine transport system permease protein|uniref:ABC transporter permease n=1 Tax=Baekduia sp. TaxID=2600305 RepID=UPI002DFADBDD|nr:ABC transporter permease [Baekduia sp.]
MSDTASTLPQTPTAAARRPVPWSLHRSPRARRIALRTLSLAVFLGAWWLVAELNVWSDLFVPDPTAVFDRLIDGETTHNGARGLSGYYLHEHLWHSLWRILRGVGWAIVFGVPLGLLLATVTPFRVIFEPYVTFVRALPPLAYFSLLIIWFGIEDASKVWLLFLAAFPPITLSVLHGVRGIPRRQLDGALALGANRWQVTRFVVLPSVLPELFTGIRLAIGFAWTTIVAAETVDGIPGIGGLAWETKKFQQTDVAVLCIVLIGLSAIVLDQLVRALEQRVVPWRGKS